MIHTIIISLALSLAAAASICTRNVATVGVKIGSANGVIISDGPFGTPPQVFANVPQEAVRRAYRYSFRDTPLLGANILLLDLEAGRTLFETGSLNSGNPNLGTESGQLFDTLRNNDICRDTIKNIVLTHGHRSRVGGLTTLEGEIAFPNATLYISREEHEYWAQDPFPFTPDTRFLENFVDAYARTVLPYQESGQLKLVEMNSTLFEGVSFIPAPGHSPGHVHIDINVDDERLIITGDSMVTRGDQVRHPDWATFIEVSTDDAYASRVGVMEMAAESRVPLLMAHEEFPGLGYIKKDGDVFDYQAVPTSQVDTNVVRRCM